MSQPQRSRTLRSLPWVVLVMVSLAMLGRAIVQGNEEMQAGQVAETAGDFDSAVLNYRHALQWYVPVVAERSEALESLLRIGAARQQQGDVAGALVAYRAARSSIMATRSVFVPHEDALPDIHQRIAELMAVQSAGSAGPSEADVSRFRSQLDGYATRSPNSALMLLGSLGFVAWIFALGNAAWRGISADGKVAWRSLGRWLALAMVSLFVWLVSVRFA